MGKRDFNLKREIEKYINQIASDVLSVKKKKEVTQEYTAHFEDSVYHYMLSGYNEKEAFKKVCDDMGDISKIRVLLSETHNSKVQLFIVEYLLRGARKFLRGKAFVAITIIFFILLLLLLFDNYNNSFYF